MKSCSPLLLIAFNFWLSNLTIGQNTLPLNSNLLIENGIPPKVLDAALSSTLLEGSLKRRINVTQIRNGIEESQAHFNYVYDPKYKDGIDIQMEYDPDSLGSLDTKYLLYLMEEMHSFSRNSLSNLYDESSLRVIAMDDKNIILSFIYDKNRLEPELKYGKNLIGKIYLKNGDLDKVELTNMGKIKYRKRRIKPQKFKSVNYFEKALNSGGYLITRSIDTYTYKKGKDQMTLIIESITYDYKNKDGIPVQWESKPNEPAPNPSTKFLDGSLGWALPIYGKNAKKLGYKLPRPIGISIFSHLQTQELQFKDLQVGLNDGELRSINSFFNLPQSTVPQQTNFQMIRADVWILPFLNISGVVGQGTNSISGQLFLDDDFKATLKRFGWLIGIGEEDVPDYIPLNADLNSISYGGGVTLAAGIDHFNLSCNYQFVFSSVLEANTTKVAHVVSPSIGYLTPLGINIMVGAQGQFYNTLTEGFITLPNQDRITYAVDFEPIQWNFTLGLYVPISNHFDLSIQSGFGDRTSITTILGYRL